MRSRFRAGRLVCRSVLAALCAALALYSSTVFTAPGMYPLPAESESAKTVYHKGGTVIDYGNTEKGYVLVRHEPSAKRLKVRITKSKGAYTYDLNGQGSYEVFPLQMGDGKYKVQLYEEAKNGQYAALESKTISVKLENENIPYLYPSQYVNYGEVSATADESFKLCAEISVDADKVKTVYGFLSNNILYYFKRARSVKTGYLPVLDEVLAERRGICFDYAALMACMLRVQEIPSKLVIGYADKAYHAWNEILVDGTWKRYDATFNSMGATASQYEPERYY